MKEIIINVRGMVCNGCENWVKNALKNIEGVENVIVNHESGMVTVTLKEEIDVNIVIKTIENLGYEIIKED